MAQPEEEYFKLLAQEIGYLWNFTSQRYFSGWKMSSSVPPKTSREVVVLLCWGQKYEAMLFLIEITGLDQGIEF